MATMWRMRWDDGCPDSVTNVRTQMASWIDRHGDDPRLEAVERSDDGGKTWRSTEEDE